MVQVIEQLLVPNEDRGNLRLSIPGDLLVRALVRIKRAQDQRTIG